MPTALLAPPAPGAVPSAPTPDPVLLAELRRITRRRMLDLTAGSAAVLALAACGGSAAPGPGDGATRTVEGASGPVEVPVSPQRVVATDYYTTYALLDVGFTVVGTAEATVGGVLPSLQTAYDAIPKLGSPSSLSMEAVVAQRPDLILGTRVPNLPADLERQLSAVAPTLLFAAGGTPGTWQERAIRAADAVGRAPEAEALRARYEQHARDVAARHRRLLDRIRIGLVRGGQDGSPWVDFAGSWSGVVLGAVGARLPAFTEGRPGAGTQVALEEIGVLGDCDVLLHLADTRGGIDGNTRRLLESPVFRALPAARAGRVHPLPNYYASHYGQGEAVLTELDRILAGQPV